MFSLSRRKTIFRLSVIGVFVVAVLSLLGFFVINKINYNVDAAAGDTANISPGQQITYGNEGWATNRFDVTVNGVTHNGFCANPSLSTPQGSYTVNKASNTEDYNAVKLLIYIYENNNSFTSSARDAIYDWSDDSNGYYAWTHAIIGAIYAGDYYGAHDEADWINGKISILKGYIRNDADVWAVAKSYTLYYTNGAGLQDIVWIEGPNLIHGNIGIQKCDAETNICFSRGERDLSGIKFSLYNNGEKIYNDRTNKVYANGDLVATATTNSDGEASFTNLVGGSYLVVETATNSVYALGDNQATLVINQDGETENATFYDRVNRGDVKFVKQDPTNDHVMSDVLFSISALDENNQVTQTHLVVSDSNGVVDTSANPHSFHTNGYDELYDLDRTITYQGYGTWFESDSSLKQSSIDDDAGALPYGSYLIQELKCSSNFYCYGIKDQKITIRITEEGQVIDLGDWDNSCAELSLHTTATDNSDGDHFIEADSKATIKDEVEYCVREDMKYTLKGVLMDKKTNEPLTINGKTFEQEVEINPTEPCGSVDMLFTFDSSALAGTDVVVFEYLYYHDDLVASHEDIDDLGQTVEVISLKTYAVNNATGEKILPYDEEEVEIKDTVKYCLKTGREYTIKGVLMDKTTKNGVLSNSKPVEAEITFTPEKTCGEVEMFYKLNTTDLGGRELVIFESLYLDDILILDHRDFENTSETVSVELPAPDTGYFTAGQNSGNSNNLTFIMVVSAVALGGYLVVRITSRYHFLHRK